METTTKLEEARRRWGAAAVKVAEPKPEEPTPNLRIRGRPGRPGEQIRDVSQYRLEG